MLMRHGSLNLKRHLYEVVLHDVADDAELVKVAAAALRAERLLEADLHVADVVPVPGRSEEGVGKAHHQHVLHQLLAQVMVDPAGSVLAHQRGSYFYKHTDVIFYA